MAVKRIIVTGGCGYIGSHTVVDLLNHGMEVIIIDDNSRSNESVIQAITEITKKTPIFYKIDLKNKIALNAVFQKEKNIDGIIHFAAYKYVDESVKMPLWYYENNIVSLLNILEKVEEYNIPNFVFSSSCSVYGNISSLPVSEDTILNPCLSPYASTKKMGEEIIEDCSKNNSCKFISLRYFNPVGAHESALIGESPTNIPNNLLPRITGTALGKFDSFKIYGTDYPTRDGTCIRDYIHVMDIAEAHTKALLFSSNSNFKNYEIINLGSENGITVREMIQAFEKMSGITLNIVEAPRRDGDVIAVYADNNKAKKLLDWQPRRDIQTIMESAWRWDKKMIHE